MSYSKIFCENSYIVLKPHCIVFYIHTAFPFQDIYQIIPTFLWATLYVYGSYILNFQVLLLVQVVPTKRHNFYIYKIHVYFPSTQNHNTWQIYNVNLYTLPVKINNVCLLFITTFQPLYNLSFNYFFLFSCYKVFHSKLVQLAYLWSAL